MEDIEFNLYKNEQKLAYESNKIIASYYQMENKREQEKKKT